MVKERGGDGSLGRSWREGLEDWILEIGKGEMEGLEDPSFVFT